MAKSQVQLFDNNPGDIFESNSGRFQNKRNAILVLGMHRSGTSCLTKVLGLRGAALPKRCLPLSENNQTGYWESSEILAIHEEILASVSSTWHDVSRFPRSWYGSELAAAFRQRLVAALNDEFDAAPLFVVKDPRACRLVELWLSVLDELNANPLIVIPVRNPLEVAASLRVRNGLDETQSLLLWLGHFLYAEKDSRGVKRCFVAYDELLGDWPRAIDRIERTLAISPSHDSRTADIEIEQFLRPELRNHHFEESATYPATRTAQWARAAHHWALGAIAGRPPSFARIDAVRAAFEAAVPESSSSGSGEQAAAAQAARLRECRKAEANQVRKIFPLNEAVIERLSLLARYEKEAAGKDREILALREEIAAIQSSTSWRMTAFLRNAKTTLTSVVKRTASGDSVTR